MEFPAPIPASAFEVWQQRSREISKLCEEIKVCIQVNDMVEADFSGIILSHALKTTRIEIKKPQSPTPLNVYVSLCDSEVQALGGAAFFEKIRGLVLLAIRQRHRALQNRLATLADLLAKSDLSSSTDAETTEAPFRDEAPLA